jgi:hypothetical protein
MLNILLQELYNFYRINTIDRQSTNRLFMKISFLYSRDDDSSRPSKHYDSVSRLKGSKKAPAFFKNDLAISQRGKGDHRKVEGFLQTLDRTQDKIGERPNQGLQHGDDEHREDNTDNPVLARLLPPR